MLSGCMATGQAQTAHLKVVVYLRNGRELRATATPPHSPFTNAFCSESDHQPAATRVHGGVDGSRDAQQMAAGQE